MAHSRVVPPPYGERVVTPPRSSRGRRARRHEVVDLAERRAARDGLADSMRRIEHALLTLAPLVRDSKVTRSTETELLAALGSVSTGRFAAAAERLERLATRLTPKDSRL